MPLAGARPGRAASGQPRRRAHLCVVGRRVHLHRGDERSRAGSLHHHRGDRRPRVARLPHASFPMPAPQGSTATAAHRGASSSPSTQPSSSASTPAEPTSSPRWPTSGASDWSHSRMLLTSRRTPLPSAPDAHRRGRRRGARPCREGSGRRDLHLRRRSGTGRPGGPLAGPPRELLGTDEPGPARPLRRGFRSRGWRTMRLLASVAEHAHGAAVGLHDTVTLLAGDRFGAGVVVDGNRLHGAARGRGRDPGAEESRRGRRGLRHRVPDRRLGPRPRRGGRPPGRSCAAPAARRRPPPLPWSSDLARRGDAESVAIAERAGMVLSRIAGCSGSLYDPERIIIAGAVAAGIEEVLEVARGRRCRASSTFHLRSSSPRRSAPTSSPSGRWRGRSRRPATGPSTSG